jgi:hypothetical protein
MLVPFQVPATITTRTPYEKTVEVGGAEAGADVGVEDPNLYPR